MSTRSTILYGSSNSHPCKTISLDGEEVFIEPYTHIWHEMMDDCVYVQVLTDHLEIVSLHDQDGNIVGSLVTVKLPKNTSAAVHRAFKGDEHP